MNFATSYDGIYCANCKYERTVRVWNLRDRTLVSEFDTVLSFGGDRLAITPDGMLCAAGAYHRHGIAAYRVSDGSVVWHRKDLKTLQVLTFDSKQDCWVACFEEGPCRFLEIETGRTLRELRGVHGLTISPYEDAVFVEYARKNPNLEVRTYSTFRRIATIPRRSPDVMHAAFGPSCVFIAEMCATKFARGPDGDLVEIGYNPPDGGPLRAISIEDGSLLWEYKPGEENQVDRVAYGETTGRVHGIMTDRLVSLDVETGVVLKEISPPEGIGWDGAFALKGDVFVSHGGGILDLREDTPKLRPWRSPTS